MQALTQSINIKQETVFWTLVGMIFSLVLLYGYFVNITIFNVADRSKLETSITQINSSLGQMEFEFLSLKSGITIEKAHELGFKEVASTQFVSLDSSAKNLSYNNR